MTTIYNLKDPRNGEIYYVGCTKNIQQRIKAHLNPARDLITPKRKWIKELRDIGLKPLFSILEEVDDSIALEREKYFIQTFRKLGSPLTNTGNFDYNGNQTSFQKGENNIPIIAISLDGTFFNSYPSVSSAAKINNTTDSNISSVLRKITKTAKNLIWVYEDEYYDLTEDDINSLITNALDNSTKGGKETQFEEGHTPWNKGKSIKIKGDKHVFQYSGKTGEFIKEWNTAKEAATILNGNEEAIGQCARGKLKTSNGYIWKYTKYDKVEAIKYNKQTAACHSNKLN
ncbi:MAG: GIY-YIG nuclease family protein [Candidatus Omnitrophica bacterium]|jgi:predicted GIY-YIG superfamily endonuclease|nr:GIY-YIG nuclease family protein [Candidatus Omnitrophota bacterium]